MSQRDNTNSGILYKNTDDWKIIQQGKLNIDGEEQRIIGVSRKNKDGQPMVSFTELLALSKRMRTSSLTNHPTQRVLSIELWTKVL